MRQFLYCSLLTAAPIVQSAVISVPQSINQDTQVRNLSVTAKTYCISDPSWGTFNFDDCYELDRAFWKADIHKRGNPHNDFEWLSHGAIPVTHFPILTTPRRFTHKTCTLAIVSLHDIPAGVLSVAPPGLFPKSDVAKVGQVYFQTTWPLTSDCLNSNEKKFGWAVTGLHKSIAVMYFQTRSRLDRALPRGLHPSP